MIAVFQLRNRGRSSLITELFMERNFWRRRVIRCGGRGVGAVWLMSWKAGSRCWFPSLRPGSIQLLDQRGQPLVPQSPPEIFKGLNPKLSPALSCLSHRNPNKCSGSCFLSPHPVFPPDQRWCFPMGPWETVCPLLESSNKLFFPKHYLSLSSVTKSPP